jgi:hypothetical protein
MPYSRHKLAVDSPAWFCYDNILIADYLIRLTTTHKRWGFKLCYLYLRNIKGYKFNHKRVYRIYRELELNLRIKHRRRIKRDRPEALSVPSKINQTWSMDFMADSLTDGRSIRAFNVIDDYKVKFQFSVNAIHSLMVKFVAFNITQAQIAQLKTPALVRCG